MKKNKLILTTRFHENRPVSLGGIGLWSKRLNGEEEMLLQEVNLSSISSKIQDRLNAEVGIVVHLLQARVRDDVKITPEWVQEHVGHLNGTQLISYLRTGEGLPPGETLDLPVFEPLELEGRTFTSRALSYGELLAAAQKSDELDALGFAEEAQALGNVEAQEGETSDQMFARIRETATSVNARSQVMIRATADLLADNLNVRIGDGGAPIDGAWLLSHLMNEDMELITRYLRDGSTPDDDEEDAETPKTGADGGAST
jgi:hypothetical protein